MNDTPYTSAVHDALTGAYAQLKIAVELFKTIKEVDKDLQMVMKGSVPNAAVDEGELDDCGYADELIAAMRLMHSGRFLKLPSMVRTTVASIKAAEAKIEKLDERIKRDGGPERSAAIRLKEKHNEGLQTLNNRALDLVARWCKSRNAILDALDTMCAEMATLVVELPPEASDVCRKATARHRLESLARSEQVMSEEREKRKVKYGAKF